MGQEMEGAQMNKIDTGIAELLAKQPSDSAEKDAYIAEFQKTVRLLSDEVRNMDELLALLRKKQFGPSSEQTKPTEEQLGLFNEAEQENKPEPKEPIKKDARGYHILNALEKWKLCKNIQIENVDFDIPPEQRNCSNCGTQMKLLGKIWSGKSRNSFPQNSNSIATGSTPTTAPAARRQADWQQKRSLLRSRC